MIKLPLYELHNLKKWVLGNSLAVQWTGLCAFTAGGHSSIPGQGTKVPQATLSGQNKIK